MQPLYFLPDMTQAALFPAGNLSQAVLRERGLERIAWDVRTRPECSVAGCERGPTGGRGLIVSFDDGRTPPDPLGYYKEQQTWRQIGPQTWFGYLTDQPPRPEDLQRRSRLIGHDVVLRNQAWHVPVLRFPSRINEGQVLAWRTQLPRVMGWTADNEFMTNVREEWRWLWDRSERMWDLVIGTPADEQGVSVYSLEEVADLAIDVLTANYRVDRGVATVLELIDSSNWEEVLRAAIDWPRLAEVLEAQKKTANCTEDGGPSSWPGSEDSAPPTVPAEPSCT